jgi:hypothetical protein
MFNFLIIIPTQISLIFMRDKHDEKNYFSSKFRIDDPLASDYLHLMLDLVPATPSAASTSAVSASMSASHLSPRPHQQQGGLLVSRLKQLF